MDDPNSEKFAAKNEVWQRLADSRTGVLKECLRKIGNLSNTGNYAYTTADKADLFGKIRNLVDLTEKQFKDWSDGKKSQSEGTAQKAEPLRQIIGQVQADQNSQQKTLQQEHQT